MAAARAAGGDRAAGTAGRRAGRGGRQAAGRSLARRCGGGSRRCRPTRRRWRARSPCSRTTRRCTSRASSPARRPRRRWRPRTSSRRRTSAGRRPARVHPSAGARGGLRRAARSASAPRTHRRAARLLVEAGASGERVSAHLLESRRRATRRGRSAARGRRARAGPGRAGFRRALPGACAARAARRRRRARRCWPSSGRAEAAAGLPDAVRTSRPRSSSPTHAPARRAAARLRPRAAPRRRGRRGHVSFRADSTSSAPANAASSPSTWRRDT